MSQLLLFLFILIIPSSFCIEWPSIEIKRPRDCSVNQTFDPTFFKCNSCPKNQVPDDDGFGCHCQPGWLPYIFFREGAPEKRCKKCPAGETPSREEDRCIRCVGGLDTGCQCKEGEIKVERGLNGASLVEIECLSCGSDTKPDNDASKCVPCPLLPPTESFSSPTSGDKILLQSATRSCNCTMAGGICLPQNLGIQDHYTPSSNDGKVQFGLEEVNSAFLKEHVKVAAYMCLKHHNTTGCQLLANLCAMSMHDKGQKSCELISSLQNDKKMENIPHLYFSDRMRANTLAQYEDITNVYNMRRGNNRLNFTVAKYSLRGHFLGMEDNVPATIFQMCNGSYLELDAAFEFGTRYHRSCQLPVSQLLSLASASDPIFYDLFVPFTAEKEKLFAVPMLLTNFGKNKKDSDDWMFTSRFFLVDGVTAGPKKIKYLSKMHLNIEMLDTREHPEKAGRMLPPIAEIEYSEISLEEDDDENSEVSKKKKISFEFSVSYKMNMKESKKDIEIAMGVLSVFAVLWSAKGTWSWSRRSGKMAIDPMTLAKLLALTCGSLANTFLVVIFFSSLFWFLFFKYQGYLHVMLPDPDQEMLIKHYVISIFALKIVDICHLLVSQMGVDIFLVDWERPHPLATAANGGRPALPSTTGGDAPDAGSGVNAASNRHKEASVSVWRTYLVANEWNELQTMRKTHLGLQIVLVLFILKTCGVEHVATADPNNNFSVEEGVYSAEYSYVCRFALTVCVYLSVALFQAFFWCVIFSGIFEDKFAQFTDVCSLANISVFVMANNNFGYYIHGKSAHGFADTDMATLIGQLQREAEDFCGHRGLQAGSDLQTFSMGLPSKLRTYYDKIVAPASEMAGARAGPSVRQLSGTAAAHMVNAYATMNKFLTRFLEHALKDLDFEVREKVFLEKVLDMEFQDPSIADKAVFYSGGIHSFDSVLLFGHEFSLTIFDMMIFLFVDLFAEDFLLAGIITFFVGEIVKFVRFLGGKSNLARKTLIDKRFLI